MNIYSTFPEVKKIKFFNSSFFLTILIVSLLSSITLASEVSKESTFLNPGDLKLAIKYPILLNQNIVNNFPTEKKFANYNPGTNDRLKSKGKAFLFSLLLPGAGEYYIGQKTLAKTFFITELVLWAGYFSFQAYSDWKRDDMYIFASTHANADVEDKPAQYFVDIGNYNDIYEYNDAKQRQREFYKVYSEDDYYWSWDVVENRNKFEHTRISSDLAHNRSIFTIGGIIANHLLSAIDAVLQTYRYNKKLNQKTKLDKGIRIHFGGINSAGNLLISVEKAF